MDSIIVSFFIIVFALNHENHHIRLDVFLKKVPLMANNAFTGSIGFVINPFVF